jgi:hypothetical protein
MVDAVLQMGYAWAMPDPIYKRRVSYTFKAGGETWELTACDGPCRDADPHEGYAFIEETRKNGQEDSHCWGELYKRRGHWELEEDAAGHIRYYMGSKMVAALEAFFNTHEPPLDFS